MSYDISGTEIWNALNMGDIPLLEAVLNKYPQRNLLEISEDTNWNWLHKILSGLELSKNKPSSLSVKYLINKNIPVNAQDIYGMTPLHYAMRSHNADAAIALLEAGADPNIPNIDNLRPLSMVGYTKDRLDVLELMLQKGGNVHNIINDNETILESWLPSENDEQWVREIYEMMKQYA